MYSNKKTESELFGKWLRQQRKAAGLTLREAGDLVDKPHSFIAKIETGQRRLDVIEYAWYCQRLGFDPIAGLKRILHPTDC